MESELLDNVTDSCLMIRTGSMVLILQNFRAYFTRFIISENIQIAVKRYTSSRECDPSTPTTHHLVSRNALRAILGLARSRSDMSFIYKISWRIRVPRVCVMPRSHAGDMRFRRIARINYDGREGTRARAYTRKLFDREGHLISRFASV